MMMAEAAGANKLRKVIQQLEAHGALRSIVISKLDESLIEIEKRSSGSEVRTDFAFLIRLEKQNGREAWWPVQYRSSSGELISCETTVNGKTMVNLAKQDSLVDLAETWAKTLEAQVVTAKVGSALL
jgi:hypothetical protein